MNKTEGKIIIPSGIVLWPHEMRVARILSNAGHKVEFIPKSHTRTADILLNGVEFEIKSPEHFNPNTLEHMIRDALKQSANIIIDISRVKKIPSNQIQRFLIRQIYRNSRIKRMLMITKRGEIIDITELA